MRESKKARKQESKKAPKIRIQHFFHKLKVPRHVSETKDEREPQKFGVMSYAF
jgi:hypothetical protein